MPEFLADPWVLTKEKLKSELIANNVSLPGGEQRKDVYVQLYLQHLTARNAPAALAQPDFSSDEEREPTPLGARSRGGAAPGRVGDRPPAARVTPALQYKGLWRPLTPAPAPLSGPRMQTRPRGAGPRPAACAASRSIGGAERALAAPACLPRVISGEGRARCLLFTQSSWRPPRGATAALGGRYELLGADLFRRGSSVRWGLCPVRGWQVQRPAPAARDLPCP